jgi:hypothetical protein
VGYEDNTRIGRGSNYHPEAEQYVESVDMLTISVEHLDYIYQPTSQWPSHRVVGAADLTHQGVCSVSPL